MATLLSTIRTKARNTLLETSASFWSEAELLEHMVDGIKDLWKAVVDLNGSHFRTIDITSMSIAASGTTVTGVPADLFRVQIIEPRDTTSASDGRYVQFVPRKYNSAEFQWARSQSSVSPTSGGIIYYDISQPGAPLAAPTIHIAPSLSSALTLRVAYIPTLADTAFNDPSTDYNPIPGESDNALYAWIVAFARAKERDDRSPDPNWLAVYSTEKQAVLTVLDPRQEQEPKYVEGMFEGWG